MTVEHSQPSVGTAATAVARAIGVTEQIAVHNPSAVAVYLGGSTVTTASCGYVLNPSETFTAGLLYIDAHIEMDRIGSRDEYVQ